MKTAFLSDVHGNLEALLSVKQSLEQEKVDKVFFLGDIVGYGAEPDACIDIIRSMTDTIIAGNHDWAACGRRVTDHFNPMALQAITWTKRNISGDNLDFLSGLPLKQETDGFLAVHSTPMNTETWGYILTAEAAESAFSLFSRQMCFIAHSHVPAAFIQTAEGRITVSKSDRIAITPALRLIINVGSVGQPRDGNPLSSYGIYDSEKKEYLLFRVPYDIAAAQKKILAAGLPPFLANRIERGK